MSGDNGIGPDCRLSALRQHNRRAYRMYQALVVGVYLSTIAGDYPPWLESAVSEIEVIEETIFGRAFLSDGMLDRAKDAVYTRINTRCKYCNKSMKSLLLCSNDPPDIYPVKIRPRKDKGT